MKKLLTALRICIYGKSFLVKEKRARLLCRLKNLKLQDEVSMYRKGI